MAQGPRGLSVQGPSGIEFQRCPEVSRVVKRSQEVSRVQPGVETAASAALQFSTSVELGLRMLGGWFGGWVVSLKFSRKRLQGFF